MSNILSEIERTTKLVASNSKNVSINYQVIDEIIAKGEFDKVSYWLASNPYGLLDMSCREIVNFLLIYHTIGDYCFWGDPKWTIKTDEGTELDGSMAMMYLIIKRYKEEKSFEMSMLTFSTWLDGNVEIPLLKERYDCLCELNRYLKSLKSDFYDEIKDFKEDISLLDYIINHFSYFDDESIYNGDKVYFYKRAQLLTSDILHVREIVEKVNVDYSHLVGCADYKIPQVMRNLGMLEYSDELAKLVDNKVNLKYGSEMEVEIRANDLVVIDYIAKKLNNKVSRMDINDYIWLLGQNKSKNDKPYHRTLTIYY